MIKQIDKNYNVTDDGKIFSRARAGTKGGELKQIISKTGYYVVTLGSSKKPTKVHRLVALAFIPNPDNKPFINHKDGCKLNNNVGNLEWCTSKENSEHASKYGLLPIQSRGADVHTAKLSWTDVAYIRDMYKPRDKQFGARALGRKFNVSHTRILDIINYISY